MKHLMAMMCMVLMALVALGAIQKDTSAESEQGSITVKLHELETPKGDVTFQAYHVGSWNASEGKWELDKSLAATGVNLEKLTTAQELETAAKTLIEKGNLEELDGTKGQTNESGTMVLSGLKWGVYLLEQTSGEDVYGTVSPLLVTIPSFDSDGTRVSNVTVEPKAQAPVLTGPGRIEVTKRAGYLDPELLEVIDLIPEDAVYYVGIFRDERGNSPYGTDYVREIRMQGVSTGTAVFENLAAGTYYIFETDSQGNVYQVGDVQDSGSDTWVCNLEEGSSQKVTLDGNVDIPEGTVGFYNLYYDLPEGYSYQGKINIEKKVLDADKKTIQTADTFYAGVFRNKDATDLFQVVELVQNDTVTVEVPLGGQSGQDPITYYVYETDESGTVLEKDTFDYEISGEGNVKVEKGKLNADLSITNMKKKSPAEGTTKADDDKNKSSKKGSSAKTGDNNPIAFYLIILIVALIGIGMVTRSRILKGRKKDE